MGYANDTLGDYRAVRDTVGGKTGTTVTDTMYSLFRTRFPGFRASDWVKVVVAAPAPKPIPAPAPAPVTVTPSALPPRVAPPPMPSVPASTPVQAAAPLVAAAATPIVGPIAAAIPPIVDAAQQPGDVRIRVAPTPPSVSLSPAPSGDTGTGVTATGDTALPDVSQASVAGGPLEMVKSLPPAVLAAGAGFVLFLLSRRR